MATRAVPVSTVRPTASHPRRRSFVFIERSPLCVGAYSSAPARHHAVARGALTSADSMDAEDESLVRTGEISLTTRASRPPATIPLAARLEAVRA